MNFKNIMQFYQNEIANNFWPFWEKAFDHQYGGVFTCFSNDGSELVSTDKYTWSQGRFLWLCSELYRMTEQKLLPMDLEDLQSMADKTYAFLTENTCIDGDQILYAVKKDGTPIDGQLGISIYADCFYVLGINKYAEVFGNREAFRQALLVYESIVKRIKTGSVRTEPYPIPDGFLSHSLQMILLNVTQEIETTGKYFPEILLNHPNALEISQHIIDQFFLEDGRCIELYPEQRENDDTLLARHVNPGHLLESVWFHIHSLRELEESDYVRKLEVLGNSALKALELGWDEQFGGLMRFVDKEGGKPQGSLTGASYEKLIRETWDTKLWWPHSESLYTLLLLYKKTNRKEFLEWYDRLFDYIFSIFPNPNQEIGEWIQIRDRSGEPLNKVVALPVKDPFHVIRNFILIINLLKK